jgi:hypothetical protein
LASPKVHLQTTLFDKSLGEQSPNSSLSLGDVSDLSSNSPRPSQEARWLALIDELDLQLQKRFEKLLIVQKSLNRQLVSFQANKQRPAFRWYKYKEAFSASLIDFLLSRYEVRAGSVLDPFAGAGTSLFVASEVGLGADGIELLPIGQEIIRTRVLLKALKPAHLKRLHRWADASTWRKEGKPVPLPQLRITMGAFAPKTTRLIERYLGALSAEPPQLRQVLRFALLRVLECVSFTRKDGQYLRWDYRSGRYLALGELKGGIDPAGADEHWKTAKTALHRIRTAFAAEKVEPKLFFVGAAVALRMAGEIWQDLQANILSNAGNLTSQDHVASICTWVTEV